MTTFATPLNEKTFLGGISAAVSLTPTFRLGTADLDFTDQLVDVRGLRQHRLEPVRVFLDEAMSRYSQADVAASDSWLGPRLHAALRLSRREAGNRDVWRFLGVWGADFVRWRFGPAAGEEDPDKAAKTERFLGPTSKHALARLWWMAEVFRDGNNYSTAALALTNQDIINNLFRMSISNHRPTALAALAVLPASGDGKSLPDGRRANALAKATNAAASTLLLDLIGPDTERDVTSRRQWENVSVDFDPRIYFDDLPEGPDDGETPPESIKQMKVLLEQLLAEAPIRGSKPAS
ncbi:MULTISPECIES: DUF6339 family protein [Micrococcaceae]|uniref:DUF6339 family protein n=1 Tax=Micrococcaceae TaxID=1268 RepID=UPI0006F6E1C2|nr:DUF6339 family protein [Arthrobacter sp. Soil761]KRE65822.1 hypothetical protein ASG79_11920 [Arthrobacter sp. Soil761]